MATIRAFQGIRPKAEYADKVAALPYDVMNSEEAREMVKDNPYSFLHVDKAEIDLDPGVYIYDDQVYAKARENLQSMIQNQILVQDQTANLYLYELTMNGRSQTGLVACTSVEEYQNNIIKKHELTREDKEQDRIRHVDCCNAHTGPIFLTYKAKGEINGIIDSWMQSHSPVYDFTAEDQIIHRVWVVDDREVIGALTAVFQEVPYLYIADGHHRSASAAKVGLQRRQQLPGYTREEEFNYFLSVIFPDEQLYIMDYNRVVKDLNGLESQQFLHALKENFHIEVCEATCKPQDKHTFGLYLDHKWHQLTAKEQILQSNDPVQMLDVSILQNYVLSPILGIQDPRTDKRIDFVGGIRGLGELVKRVNSGEMKAAFAMYPTTINDLMSIADAGQIMPPKSTWFEPKLRSGIFIHSLE